MVDVAGHRAKLKQVKAEYQRASGYRRRDLGRYIKRLQKELSECNAHMSGTYGKARA